MSRASRSLRHDREIGACGQRGLGLRGESVLPFGVARQQVERPAKGGGAGLVARKKEDRDLIDHLVAW